MSTSMAEKTIDALHAQGWHQGTLVATDGRVCLLGAMGLADGMALYDIMIDCVDVHGRSPALKNLYERLVRLVKEKTDGTCEYPHLYNDRIAKSVEDVIMLLKEADNL